MARTFKNDYIYDGDGDLLFKDGDLFLGMADNQMVEQIINSNPSEWQFYPLCGVGINRFQNADINFSVIETKIIDQLTKDGYTEIEIDVNGAGLVNTVISNNLTLNISAYRSS